VILKALYSLDIFQINSYVPIIYYEPYLYKKILYFQHQIKLPLLSMKNQTFVTLVVTPINVTTPPYMSWSENYG
jgi:hypothetical protein